jgi:hypothetical protein
MKIKIEWRGLPWYIQAYRNLNAPVFGTRLSEKKIGSERIFEKTQ